MPADQHRFIFGLHNSWLDWREEQCNRSKVHFLCVNTAPKLRVLKLLCCLGNLGKKSRLVCYSKQNQPLANNSMQGWRGKNVFYMQARIFKYSECDLMCSTQSPQRTHSKIQILVESCQWGCLQWIGGRRRDRTTRNRGQGAERKEQSDAQLFVMVVSKGRTTDEWPKQRSLRWCYLKAIPSSLDWNL